MQMKFYCDLFISEDFKMKKEELVRRLKDEDFRRNMYLITLAQGEQNNLEFYSSLLLKQHIYDDVPVFVVGIASGYTDALYMTEDIVNAVYADTRDTDIRG